MRRRSVIVRIVVVLLVVTAGLLWAAHRFGPMVGRTPFRSLKTQIVERTTDDAAGNVPLAAAEDWPAWRGPRGDGISREVGIADSWPAGGPRKLWSASVGLGYASPIAAGGRVYLFSLDDKHDALTCFDARTGHILWNEESQSGWTRDFPGTRATPAIEGNAIYTFGAAGELTRHDLQTGKPVWRINLMEGIGAKPPGYGCGSSPLVAMGKVFVQGGRGGPVAVAVDKETGQVAWKSEAHGTGAYAHPILIDVADPGGGAESSGASSPVQQLIIFGGEALYGMDPGAGRTIWSELWATDYEVNSSTPVYSPADRHLFVTSSYGMGCMMVGLSPTGAAKVWKKKEVKSKFQQTILDGGLLYANSEGRIKCLGWPDGNRKWEATPDEVKIGENGSIVRVADKLLATSDTGTLYLVRATAEGFTVLATAQAFDDSEVWATPLLYGGRLYVKGTREFACFDMSTGGR